MCDPAPTQNRPNVRFQVPWLHRAWCALRDRLIEPLPLDFVIDEDELSLDLHWGRA